MVHARPVPPDDVQHIGKYRLIKTIGRGNFAKVKLAKHVPTGRQVNVVFFTVLLLQGTEYIYVILLSPYHILCFFFD